jgi:hypothetical protein
MLTSLKELLPSYRTYELERFFSADQKKASRDFFVCFRRIFWREDVEGVAKTPRLEHWTGVSLPRGAQWFRIAVIIEYYIEN